MDTVRCPGCGEENPAKFRLCGFCGTALHPVPETVVCPGCGEENPGKFRLCGFCGTALGTGPAVAPAATVAVAGTAPPVAPAPAGVAATTAAVLAPAAPATAPVVELPAHEVRKVVTLLFSDLKDST